MATLGRNARAGYLVKRKDPVLARGFRMLDTAEQDMSTVSKHLSALFFKCADAVIEAIRKEQSALAEWRAASPW